ncbi:phage terminase large subunit [Bacillus pretiosus]|uniref:Phage terminase large subunit n=1 Tax=Bacillus pretiosus TaxID=2983392 RepID=A0ABT3EYK3_9BACI|nr:phage terminase large subunit [Bacillus pretiosus]MED2788308.1 phage terminase large subunit [Bacillus thuringiensis]MCW1241915.1 phage terminase large subunit [Bacillus pretiosus]MED2829730.1 phage terminase large subunit [Bacillus thuringiensis]MED2856409.1 phage terminase large subunit [Bacillus thuringiensis]MED2863786.1 phage terminase large subunit [Bacillus thuringiensis]
MWIGSKFLNREERAERIAIVKDRLSSFVELYENGDASEYHIETMLRDKADLVRLERVHRAEVDNAFFTMEYLSDGHNPENDDNIIQNSDDGEAHQGLDEMAGIHKEFFGLCDDVDAGTGTNLAIAAPRGHSKSGIFSNAYVLKGIVFRQLSHRYILVVSETDDLSKKLIGWCNKQLKFNKKLIEDFGCLLYENPMANERDNESSFITRANQLVEASSSGKQLRGKRHGALRPTSVVVDDPSSMNNEGTKEARQKLIDWYNAVVLPIGGKTTNHILVGTMVSATGLLAHVLKRRDFRPCFYDAIVSEPKFPKMWEEYTDLYLHGEDGAADEYFQLNGDAMMLGVETAWEWRWTYKALMERKANMGTKTFNSEYRNRAFSEDEKFFFTDQFGYYEFRQDLYTHERVCVYDGESYRLRDMSISAAWDIAMGKSARSCYNSLVITGRHESTGRIFVLEEYATKEPPHKFMKGIIDRVREFRPNILAVETINAQHEFYRQLQEELPRQGIYSTKVVDVRAQKSSKEQRIESLEPYCVNKSLIFNRHHKLLLDQLDAYPYGDYVDSADALQMSVEHVARPRGVVRDKPVWL